ncbi:methyl-accepting chemotaxis protein [Uliginosibacterium sp. 31-16]|uniref:methyl-accepting chemotaxis protein n=1 Tax=Uliginosibacterium sp. 31-16 TaxID=3068315 RepID=UPI00273D0B21|nr:methyl-accepting chemotaxis protein [Uliginosibacterium sp. 31-16]MDP5240369.1 methyl-accepting chemotaxis protein [Uliginosibacterium sp. 31-16]
MFALLSRLKVNTRLALLTAIALAGFVIFTILVVIGVQQAAMERHRERIQHLVSSAVSLVDHYQKQEASGKLSREEAQAKAKEALRALRFGEEDYFFVYDYKGVMVAHGTNPSLEGQLQTGKPDANGKLFRDEMVKAGTTRGAGFSEYVFARPGKDTTPVPKLSYVKAFAPWEWLVCTGVYVDDVSAAVRREAISYSLLALLILGLMLTAGFVISRSIVSQLGAEPASLMEIMGRAANGDLRQKFDTTSHQDSVLRRLQQMLDGLSGLVRTIHIMAGELHANAGRVAQTSHQVSDAATHQSEATSTMAAGIEEMTVAVNHIADSARQTESESQRAAELGIEGERRAASAVSVISEISSTVTQAGERIGGLVKRTDEIGSIASVIKEIAAQTNLLALNAAIEAARAGEQGRGFAVVADEVRKLAERTTQATAEISGMVEGIQNETRDAVQVMESAVPQAQAGVASTNAAAQSLREMRISAEGTLERIREVADATREQGLASNSIAQEVERIAQMVEETSQAVAGSAETASQLETLSNSLQAAVSRFSV